MACTPPYSRGTGCCKCCPPPGCDSITYNFLYTKCGSSSSSTIPCEGCTPPPSVCLYLSNIVWNGVPRADTTFNLTVPGILFPNETWAFEGGGEIFEGQSYGVRIYCYNNPMFPPTQVLIGVSYPGCGSVYIPTSYSCSPFQITATLQAFGGECQTYTATALFIPGPCP